MDRDSLPLPRYGPGYRIFAVATAVWITVVVWLGLAGDIAQLPILEETARNLYFHLPMWLVLFLGSLVGAWHSGRFLRTGRRIHDVRAEQAWMVATAFGVIAFITGVVWGRFTWYAGTNVWWTGDPRQVMVAVQLLIAGAYFVLRGGIDDPRRRGRLAAVYALFGATTLPFLLYVLPRRLASLHPGAEGNPAFSQMDIAPQMRWVLYAALLGFSLLAWWIYTVRVRTVVAQMRLADLRESRLAAAEREPAPSPSV